MNVLDIPYEMETITALDSPEKMEKENYQSISSEFFDMLSF